jgi:hypothetical protein
MTDTMDKNGREGGHGHRAGEGEPGHTDSEHHGGGQRDDQTETPVNEAATEEPADHRADEQEGEEAAGHPGAHAELNTRPQREEELGDLARTRRQRRRHQEGPPGPLRGARVHAGLKHSAPPAATRGAGRLSPGR